MKKIIKDTGGGCSICGQIPAVNVSDTYWLCGDCVSEKLTEKQTTVPKCGTFMGIKGVRLDEVSFKFSQDSDANQNADEGQYLNVYTNNNGGGAYLIIETERWAIDSDDIGKFCAALTRICNTPEEYEK